MLFRSVAVVVGDESHLIRGCLYDGGIAGVFYTEVQLHVFIHLYDFFNCLYVPVEQGFFFGFSHCANCYELDLFTTSVFSGSSRLVFIF